MVRSLADRTFQLRLFEPPPRRVHSTMPERAQTYGEAREAAPALACNFTGKLPWLSSTIGGVQAYMDNRDCIAGIYR